MKSTDVFWPLMLALSLMAPSTLVRSEEPRQADDAKVVLDKSLKALGGVEKISKLHAVRVKGTCSWKEVKKFTFDASFAALDKVRVVVEPSDFTGNKRMILVINGGKCWAKCGEEGSHELDTETTMLGDDFLHAMCLPDLLMTLKGNGYTLATLAEDKIDGRNAIGLRVTHKNHQDVHLYFDKSSALPIKSQVKIHGKRADGKQEDVLIEFFFGKFKEIAGVSHFTQIKVSLDEDTPLEIDLKEVELREKLDPAIFTKP